MTSVTIITLCMCIRHWTGTCTSTNIPLHISLTGQGIVLIVSGLVLRVVVSFLAVLGNGFNLKEMLFVAIAWLPKATVQVS